MAERTKDSQPYEFDAAAFHAELDKAMNIADTVREPVKVPGVLREYPVGSGLKVLFFRCVCDKDKRLPPDALGCEDKGRHLCRRCGRFIEVERAG